MCDYTEPRVIVPIRGRCRSIDRCIHHIIAALNAAGVDTLSCCCGHGNRPGSIVLEDGRELIVMHSEAAARDLMQDFPDIHGEEIPTRGVV